MELLERNGNEPMSEVAGTVSSRRAGMSEMAEVFRSLRTGQWMSQPPLGPTTC